jgi:AAA domain
MCSLTYTAHSTVALCTSGHLYDTYSYLLPVTETRSQCYCCTLHCNTSNTTADATAAEESDIVLVSLGRSNKQGTMGFVNDANRLNVMVSRAKHGMILFGDLHFLTTGAHKSESGRRLWRCMHSLLQAGGHVYPAGVPLVCSRHPDVHSDAASAEQFAVLAPNGGCTQVVLLLRYYYHDSACCHCKLYGSSATYKL